MQDSGKNQLEAKMRVTDISVPFVKPKKALNSNNSREIKVIRNKISSHVLESHGDELNDSLELEK